MCDMPPLPVSSSFTYMSVTCRSLLPRQSRPVQDNRGSTTCESGPSVSIDSGFFVRLASDSFTHRAMRQSFDDATRICERIPLHTLDRANPITTINPLA